MQLNRPAKLATILLCLIFAAGLILAGCEESSIPSPTSAFYVNDFAGVLDEGTEQYIINAAAALEERTTAQLVVVTVGDIGERALEEYANDLFRKWGIGSADKDNGVLILLDVGGRQSRIEVGYGLEGALPAGKTGRSRDEYMVPYFRENDFSQGVRQSFNALLAEIYAEYGIDTEGISDFEPPVPGSITEGGYTGISIPEPMLIIGAVLIGILILIDFKVSGGAFTLALLHMFFRGGGRGGGGGGFTRGGGGRSGGGGSTRRW